MSFIKKFDKQLIKILYELRNDNIQEVEFQRKEIDKTYQALNPEIIYIEREEYTYLNKLITKLTYLEQIIIIMSFGYYENIIYSDKEITKILKISPFELNKIRKNIIIRLKEELLKDI